MEYKELNQRIKEMVLTEVSGPQAFVNEEEVRRKYALLTRTLIEKGQTITTMESCTSGQVISLLTDTEGSSAAVKGAFVTYSNFAKIMQGVPEEIIEQYGVYSKETSAFMAEACRRIYQADYGAGITGSFGNADPNNADSVPGEVYFAIASDHGTACFHCRIPYQPSRIRYKMYMADVIADALLKQIAA